MKMITVIIVIHAAISLDGSMILRDIPKELTKRRLVQREIRCVSNVANGFSESNN